MPEFQAFPKIARLHRGVTITEKLDGTNAAVGVTESGEVYAQSRTRIIVPGDDNYGFALWVSQHADELADGLGPGIHFGEWWGVGINRGYDIHERRFSLFNTHRWGPESETPPPACCHVVPVLEQLDKIDTPRIEGVFAHLEHCGSVAAAGYMNPEGIVVYHRAANTLFKYTFGGDGHKEAARTRRSQR